jgi:SAM-dependent methyltransferase
LTVRRSLEREMLDDPALPEDVAQRCYLDLDRINRFLGNNRAILRALRGGPKPVRSVVDIGCGSGTLLVEIRKKLGIEATGVELRPPRVEPPGIVIVKLDAFREPLPKADAAISMLTAHHLSEDELVELIRNAARSCPRLILLDLVRHWLPLALYRTFVAPLVSPVTAADGALSVRRAYTAGELRTIAARALLHPPARLRHSVAPGCVRQVLDITF